MNRDAIKGRVTITDVLRHYGSTCDDSGKKWSCIFPERHTNGDANPSVTINSGLANCWSQSCFKSADIFGIVGAKEGLAKFPQQMERVVELFHLPIAEVGGTSKRRSVSILRTHRWVDADGQEFYHHKVGPKKWIWAKDCAGTQWGIKGHAKPDLYQREAVLRSDTILICEGEKDAEAVQSLLDDLHLPIIATTTPCGAGDVKLSYLKALFGKTLVYCSGDNDPPGEKFAKDCAKQLTKHKTPAAILFPPTENDWAEWISQGGTARELKGLLEAAEPYHPTPEELTEDTEGGEKGAAKKKKDAKKLGFTRMMAEHIRREHFFAQDAGRLLYAFKHGCYQPIGKLVIEQAFLKACETLKLSDRWSIRQAREIVTYIQTSAAMLWDAPPLDTLNVANGLLDVSTKTLKPHSPEFLSAVQLPVTFDPAATCPAWDQFITEVFPEDAQALGYELPAYLMLPDNSQQKAMLLIGEGSNGKSTFLRAVSRFLGKQNTCAVSLHRLEEDKFAVQRLIGKLACIVPDLPSEHLSGSSVFKAITGSDDLEAERKFADSFLFTPITRLIFSANHFPQSKDSSQAFFRRWVVIPFHNTIAPGKQITREVLDARLTAPPELSGVLNKCLEGLAAMQTRGGFTQSETLQEALREFRDQTDPLATWLDQHTVLNPESFTTKKDLLIKFNAESQEAGRPPITAHTFTKGLTRLRPSIKEAQKTIGGKIERILPGLSFRTLAASSQVSQLSQVSSYLPIAGESAEEVKGGEESEEIENNLKREKVVKPVKVVNQEVFDLC